MRFEDIYLKIKNNLELLEKDSQEQLKIYYGEDFLISDEILYVYNNFSKPNTISSKVLDIGCGLGLYDIFLASNGYNVLGIDFGSIRLKVANDIKEKLFPELKNLLFKEINFFDLKSKFDYIWLEQTFHHIEPRNKFYKKVKSLLTNDGQLVILDTNSLNLLNQIIFFKKRGFKTIDQINIDGKLIPYGNERVTNPFILKFFLKKEKLKIVKTFYFKVFPKRFVKGSINLILSKMLFFIPFIFINYITVVKKIKK